MKPRKSQIEMSEAAFEILNENGLVYIAAEERTGKTLASILTAEKCTGIERVLIITKKKALGGWCETLEACDEWLDKEYDVTNYHQAHKVQQRFDLIILDEAHSYVSGYPKPSQMWKNLRNLTKGLPIIYLSATPHAQSYSLLYHQLQLSSWSPWREYKTFYKWFKEYGIPDPQMIKGKLRELYHKTQEEKIHKDIDKLFMTKTRRALGFKHEPVDQLHSIELTDETKEIYNTILKKKLYRFPEHVFVGDTAMKIRFGLYMLEGGTIKINKDYLVLDNTEKIDYIKERWGDTEDLVIFYHFIAEEKKLRQHFKKARILQGTSYAEGVDLSMYKTVVVYSQDFSTAKYTQRRARQANWCREEPITVHYLVVDSAVSEQAYRTVAEKKKNFVDSLFERLEL